MPRAQLPIIRRIRRTFSASRSARCRSSETISAGICVSPMRDARIGAGRQPRLAADRAAARDHAGRQVDYREREPVIGSRAIDRGDDRRKAAMPASKVFPVTREIQHRHADRGSVLAARCAWDERCSSTDRVSVVAISVPPRRRIRHPQQPLRTLSVSAGDENGRCRRARHLPDRAPLGVVRPHRHRHHPRAAAPRPDGALFRGSDRPP
jgi:hypothetical protein